MTIDQATYRRLADEAEAFANERIGEPILYLHHLLAAVRELCDENERLRKENEWFVKHRSEYGY